MRSETEIREMLKKLKAFQKLEPNYGKVNITYTQVQISMLEYVLEIGTGDLLQATKETKAEEE